MQTITWDTISYLTWMLDMVAATSASVTAVVRILMLVSYLGNSHVIVP